MLSNTSGLPAAIILGLLCGTTLAVVRVPNDNDCAGFTPLCMQPPAERVTVRQLHTAWPRGTAVVSYSADRTPRATCLTPGPAAAAAPCSAVESPVRTSASDLLAAWEHAASARPALSERDRAWLERRNEPVLSAHAAELAARLLGPVRQNGVLAEFRWTVVDDSMLEGVPQDEATRLLCPRVRIRLDLDQGTATTLQVLGRDARWLSVRLPEATSAAQPITLAGYEVAVDEGLPPSPAPQRLAAEAVPPATVR